MCMISNFHPEVDEILDQGQEVLDFLTLEDGTDRLSRNVGKKLPLYAMW
jgi:hypothetical protein